MLALLTMSTDLIGSLESASSILMVFWCRQLPITHRVLLEAGFGTTGRTEMLGLKDRLFPTVC
ncbi:hypothetical protein D6C83_01574 [Aureobasidium pullulans]|uniref:Uncharacterized protein n=1 Tax=Aureobasidium pullulans TaxID=5580 RepID=A0A4T0E4N1_AURPU|nr:hypothetical protein D6C83_01574 [Aureobasidium pullulans]